MIRLFIRFYLVLVCCVLLYVFSEGVIRTYVIRDMLVSDSIDDYSGAFYLADQLHQVLDPVSFNALIDDFPEDSNLPLTLHSLDTLELSAPGMAILDQGGTYVADTEVDILYQKLSNSNIVAQLGPVSTHAELLAVRDIYRGFIFVILALPVVLLLLNMQRKTRRLESVTAHFGKGDFSVRASEKNKHCVGNLNHTFNMMAERVERLIQGHKSLTNAVAHELRTPVSRVRFQLDMLYQELDDTQRKEYMHGISDDIDELGDLVDELLTYARFDREPVANSTQSHSLHESIQNVIGTRHFDSTLTIHYEESWFLSDHSLQYAHFDPKNLERAVGNLVSNAEKYARSRIDIFVKRTQEECKVIVDDDGPGIPLEQRKALFEPFKRLDDSRTRATGGYGLGLAIVKQIAQWHKGDISIGESPAGGARFVFRWPMTS